MRVPLTAQRLIDGGEQMVEVWSNGERLVVPAPMAPYFFCSQNPKTLPHKEEVLGWAREEVRLLGSGNVETWWKVRTRNVNGVRETAEWEKHGGRFAENHLRFMERILPIPCGRGKWVHTRYTRSTRASTRFAAASVSAAREQWLLRAVRGALLVRGAVARATARANRYTRRTWRMAMREVPVRRAIARSSLRSSVWVRHGREADELIDARRRSRRIAS